MSSENIETRSRILDATVNMLEEHGGVGVRMGDIAKAAGISRQAVYLHFASRAELLVAATIAAAMTLMTMTTKAAASPVIARGRPQSHVRAKAWASHHLTRPACWWLRMAVVPVARPLRWSTTNSMIKAQRRWGGSRMPMWTSTWRCALTSSMSAEKK